MSDAELFPRYIRRPEEQAIIAEARRVRDDGVSRTVLLYGSGGTGKTRLVRELAQAPDHEQRVVWLNPIDIDDSQHWLLSNLERNVARQLDPDARYFSPYMKYLSELPRYARGQTTSRETVLSHLTRIKAVFESCYRSYIEDTGKTVVMTFDTVEAIRGMYALFTLTQWMKALPATLFILVGRPPSGGVASPDPIRLELEERHSRMPVAEVRLGEFDLGAAREYIERSGVATDLSDDEKEKLICLTRGHPLWLAFTIDYLSKIGMPDEATASLEHVQRNLPLDGVVTPAGKALVDEFRRRLVAPYRDTDFWHEAIRRLAVVRESISQPVWCSLMDDLPWPDDAPDPESAWEALRRIEWVRPRANERYVTLHDAVAEELAERVIRLHDPHEEWRHDLWDKAASIYADLAGQLEAQIAEQQASVDDRLSEFGQARLAGGLQAAPADEAALIRDVAAVDGYRQEISHLRAAQVFYQLLSGFGDGARQFLRLMDQARDEHNVFFEDLLAFQMQRFLPDVPDASPLGDAVAATVRNFQEWLSGEGSEVYADIGLVIAAFLIDREQLDAALALLHWLPVPSSDHERSYRLNNLRGNAHMRIAGQVREAERDFRNALAVVAESRSDDLYKLVGQGYKELGFYYRNIGLWEKADMAYRSARDAIAMTLSAQSPASDLEEMASIQTNWAYLKGIGGDYRAGINLVESAISVRSRIGRRLEMAMSLSVLGEVYRYQRSFSKAWGAYADAEQIFEDLSSWSWLGQIYQEQAICLFQAKQDGVDLVSGQDTIELAKALILRALPLCDELNARAYPSALNRAGRIFGSQDVDRGLDYLRQAATAAHALSDGWFWFASLIEYAELNYRAWSETRIGRYIDQIATVAVELDEVTEEYGFPELRGRWDVLQGHIGLEKALDSGDQQVLATAFDNYQRGFPLIAHGYVGSYGESVIPSEIQHFGLLVAGLPSQVRAQWLQELSRSWSGEGASATLLLARLVELY
jgi:tetratricopeptide (TPR) repeat protein